MDFELPYDFGKESKLFQNELDDVGGSGGDHLAESLKPFLDFQQIDSGDQSDLAELFAKFNLSIDELVDNKPLEMPAEEQLVLNILYGVAIAVALAGNLVVILVFLFGRRWKSDLSIFLVNLAFSDVVLAVFCMPFTMSQVVKHHWQFPDILCPIVLFLQLSSVLASVYTLTAIGLDRYLFVTTPLKARLTKRKGKLVIACIWIFALGLSSVQLAVVRCSTSNHGGKQYKDCQEGWPNENLRRAYTVTVALLTYVIPLSLLSYTYIRVGRVLWQRTPPGEVINYSLSSAMTRAEQRKIKSKQRVVKMLVVIVLVFAICWLPLHLFFLLIDFFPDVIDDWRRYHEGSFTYTFLATHFLAMSSSYVNPLIYSFMNQNFRSDVRQVWRRLYSNMRHCVRKLCCQDGYNDGDEDESLKPFRHSPNSLLKRSSSTTPPAPEIIVINRLTSSFPFDQQSILPGCLENHSISFSSRSELQCDVPPSLKQARRKSRSYSATTSRDDNYD